jgi:hypothetical protein
MLEWKHCCVCVTVELVTSVHTAVFCVYSVNQLKINWQTKEDLSCSSVLSRFLTTLLQSYHKPNPFTSTFQTMEDRYSIPVLFGLS